MPETGEKPLGYGLIGCGSFGQFCLDQYRQMPELRCVAVTDTSPEAAREASAKFGMNVCATPEKLLARSDIDIVHIATPPFTHRDLAIAALENGKHVLCEKPLAIRMEHAKAMAATARRHERLLAVNLIMRYDPLCEIVQRIVREEFLGQPLHGFFENYAKDEPLGPDHWFWDKARSGGIFIEHGVHFFDLFQWWLGRGRVLSAQQGKRPRTDLVEHVNCTACYGEDVLVSFYHGFHQATRMDRQELRIVFERGDLRLFEWVPTQLRIDAILDGDTLEALKDIMPHADFRTTETYTHRARLCAGRHKPYVVDCRVSISCDAGMSKPELYGHVLRGLMADQIAAIRDPYHPRRVNETNGLSSLEMAVAADGLVAQGTAPPG